MLYDDLNRPVQTGLLSNAFNNKNFAQHLTTAFDIATYPFTLTTTPSATYWEYLTKTGYDDYSTMPAASGLTAAMDNSTINNAYGILATYNASPDYAQQIPLTASVQLKGMVTWTETKIINTTTITA